MKNFVLLPFVVVVALLTGCASHQPTPGDLLTLNADDYEQRVEQANRAYDAGKYMSALRQYDALLQDYPDGDENLCLLRTSMAMVSLVGLGDRSMFIEHAGAAKSACEEVKFPPVNTQFVLATYQSTMGDFKRSRQVSNAMHSAVSSVMKGGD